jgi:hypothetical protein
MLQWISCLKVAPVLLKANNGVKPKAVSSKHHARR